MNIKPFKKTYNYKTEDFTQAVKDALIEEERNAGYIWDATTFYGVSDDIEIEFTLLEHLQKRLDKEREEIKKKAFLE